MFDSGENLSVQRPRFLLGETTLVRDLREQLAARRVLHDDVQLGERLDHLVQTDDVRVVQTFHARDLARQQPLRLLVEFCLVEDLYGNFLCRVNQRVQN